ncbi:MAG: hypothetical protein ACHQC8_01820 [Solirubrobacterales bacterium]
MDDVEQFGAVVAALAAELDEFDRLGEQSTALGRATRRRRRSDWPTWRGGDIEFSRYVGTAQSSVPWKSGVMRCDENCDCCGVARTAVAAVGAAGTSVLLGRSSSLASGWHLCRFSSGLRASRQLRAGGLAIDRQAS